MQTELSLRVRDRSGKPIGLSCEEERRSKGRVFADSPFAHLLILFPLLASACSNADFRTRPIAEFLSGTWVVDSTNRRLGASELPRVQLLEFQKAGKVSSHFFSFRHNKEYVNTVDCVVTDSSFNYTDKLWEQSFFNAGYRLERLDPSRFRLVAKFPVSAYWSDREMDSVIWYSRVSSAGEHLKPIMATNKAFELSCELENVGLLQGYWKLDSTESINRFEPEKHYYTYFDTSGTVHVFWLGSNPYHKIRRTKLRGKYLVGDQGDSSLIRCLDDRHLVFEGPERAGFYEAVYFTRIQPDTIIPDSLRVDRLPIELQ